MATYIMFGTFTDQGIRSVKDTTKRVESFRAACKKVGASIKDCYWTLGKVDVVTIFEAPDDATMTALALSVGVLGNVKTQVLPAFNPSEMNAILGKMVQRSAENLAKPDAVQRHSSRGLTVRRRSRPAT